MPSADVRPRCSRSRLKLFARLADSPAPPASLILAASIITVALLIFVAVPPQLAGAAAATAWNLSGLPAAGNKRAVLQVLAGDQRKANYRTRPEDTFVQFAAALDEQLRSWHNKDEGADHSENFDYLRLMVPAQTLLAYRDGVPRRAYPVAIGSPADPTPLGTFHIINRVVDPTWYPSRGGDPVPPGPQNPLGNRWLGLNEPGYGLHGTNNPASIGGTVSLGCVRLLPKDIEEVFAKVAVGVPVDIVYQRHWLLPHPASDELLLAAFPDPYNLQSLDAADLQASLLNNHPVGLPQSALAPWVAQAEQSPVLVKLVSRRLALTTLNGQPLPSAEPVIIEGYDEPWLPVRPLASAVGGRVRSSTPPFAPPTEVEIDGWPVTVQIVDGRLVAPLDSLLAALELRLDNLVDSQHELLVAVSGGGVFGVDGQLLTRQTIVLADGTPAVHISVLKAKMGAQLSAATKATYGGQLLTTLTTGPAPGQAEPQVFVVLDERAQAAGLLTGRRRFQPVYTLHPEEKKQGTR